MVGRKRPMRRRKAIQTVRIAEEERAQEQEIACQIS